MSTTLTITHCRRDGSLIEGTARGDGTSEILKAAGWRYSRAVGWYVPRSRDRDHDTALLAVTAGRLRAAGFTVELVVDDTPRPVVVVEGDRRERLQERADRLRAHADQVRAKAAGEQERSRELSEGWPLGQPLISDAARRHHRRMVSASDRAYAAAASADDAEARARAAAESAASAGTGEAPSTVVNRIERLGKESRRLRRHLEGYTEALSGLVMPPVEGEARARAERELEHVLEQLEYAQSVRAAQVEQGRALVLTGRDVAAGDLVLYRRGWHRVRRVNRVSVTVEYSIAGRMSTKSIALAKLEGHQRQAER